MTQLGEAFIPVRATLDKLDGDLAAARGKVESSIGQITKNMQSIGKIAMVGISAGIGAIVSGVALVASKAIPAASNLNEAVNAVNVVFGESAGTILEWGKTADSQAGLSQAAFAQMAAQTGAMLQNFGLDTTDAADQTVLLAQRAADMASIFNTDVNDALMAIQAGLRGEANPLERFGVSMSAAAVQAKAMEMGLAGSNGELDNAALTQARLALLMEQTDKIAGDFVNTNDQLANATRVQAARWENFMAQLGGFALPIITTLQGAFTDIAERVFPIVLDAMQPVADAAIVIAEALVQLIDGLMSGEDPLGDFANFFYEIAKAFGATEEQATGVFNAVRTVGDAIGGAIEQVQAILGPIVETVGGFVSWKDVLIALGITIAAVIIPAIISFLAAAAPIIATFVLITAGVALLRNAWESNFLGIRDKTKAVIDFLVPLVTDAIAAIREWWDKNGDQLLAKAKEIWETIQNTIDTVVHTVQDIIAAVTEAIQAAWDEHGDQILASASEFWAAVQDFIDRTIKKIQEIITDVSNAIKKFWDKHGEEIMEGAQKAWDKIQEIIDLAFQQISKFFDTFAKLFKGDWEGFLDGIKDLWQNGLDALGLALEGLWGVLSPILAGIWDDISGWFDAKVKEFAKIGNNLITSLADAISNKANSYLKKVAQGVANLLPEWVKDILGISSPSKVFQKIGDQVGLGLAMGIEDSTGGVRQALDALFGELGGPGSPGLMLGGFSGLPQFELGGLSPALSLAGIDAGNTITHSYSSTTTIHTNQDPMRVLRASRHLDKLGALP